MKWRAAIVRKRGGHGARRQAFTDG
jgi:hypothetical protein